MNLWGTVALFLVAVSCAGRLCWMTRKETKLAEHGTRPGSDGQFAEWIKEIELADRAEEGRDA